METATCEVVIMAHPSRLPLVERIAEQCAPIRPTVVVDPDPGTPHGALRTATSAWKSFREADYHLCLQDDVVLCPNFAARLAELLCRRPVKPVALFTNWGSRTSSAVRLAAMTGRSWAPVLSNYVPTQALLVPAGLSGPLGDFLEQEGSSEEGDDFAIRRFFARESIDSLVSVPNLVDHDDVPSLLRNGTGRRSVLFHDSDRPLTWDGPELAVTVLPYQEWGTGRALCQLGVARPGVTIDVIPAAAYLRGGGLSNGELLGAFRRALVEGGEVLEERIGWGFLLELWLNAAALGRTMTGPVEDALGPTGRAALATMPHGALRGLVPAADLTVASEDLKHFLIGAVAFGAASRDVPAVRQSR